MGRASSGKPTVWAWIFKYSNMSSWSWSTTESCICTQHKLCTQHSNRLVNTTSDLGIPFRLQKTVTAPWPELISHSTDGRRLSDMSRQCSWEWSATSVITGFDVEWCDQSSFTKFFHRHSFQPVNCVIITKREHRQWALIIYAKWTEWNWRILGFHFCLSVRMAKTRLTTTSLVKKVT